MQQLPVDPSTDVYSPATSMSPPAPLACQDALQPASAQQDLAQQQRLHSTPANTAHTGSAPDCMGEWQRLLLLEECDADQGGAHGPQQQCQAGRVQGSMHYVCTQSAPSTMLEQVGSSGSSGISGGSAMRIVEHGMAGTLGVGSVQHIGAQHEHLLQGQQEVLQGHGDHLQWDAQQHHQHHQPQHQQQQASHWHGEQVQQPLQPSWPQQGCDVPDDFDEQWDDLPPVHEVLPQHADIAAVHQQPMQQQQVQSGAQYPALGGPEWVAGSMYSPPPCHSVGITTVAGASYVVAERGPVTPPDVSASHGFPAVQQVAAAVVTTGPPPTSLPPGTDPVLAAGARSMAEQLVQLARNRPDLLLNIMGGILDARGSATTSDAVNSLQQLWTATSQLAGASGAVQAAQQTSHNDLSPQSQGASPPTISAPPAPASPAQAASASAATIPPYAVIQQLPPRVSRRRGGVAGSKRRRMEAAHGGAAAAGGGAQQEAVPMQVMSALLQLVVTAVHARQQQGGGAGEQQPTAPGAAAVAVVSQLPVDLEGYGVPSFQGL